MFVFEIFNFQPLLKRRIKLMKKQISIIMTAALVAFVATSMADSTPEASAQDTKKMVQNNFV